MARPCLAAWLAQPEDRQAQVWSSEHQRGLAFSRLQEAAGLGGPLPGLCVHLFVNLFLCFKNIQLEVSEPQVI